MSSFFFQQLTVYETVWVLVSCLLNIAALSVIFSRNPVISVFNMILSFLFGSMLVFLTGSDFLAFVYIIVYMGAIVVLFLFVVMMLQIKPTSFKMALVYSPVSILLGLVLLAELFFVLDFTTFTFSKSVLDAGWILTVNPSSNILVLGQLMYTYYFLFFLVSGLILLVALVSAILLTLKYFKVNSVSPAVSLSSSPVTLRVLQYSMVGLGGTAGGNSYRVTLSNGADGLLNLTMILSYTALGLYFISVGMFIWASSWHQLAMTEAALNSRSQSFRAEYVHELYSNYFTFFRQTGEFKIFKFPTQQSLAYMRDVVIESSRRLSLAQADVNAVSFLGVYDRHGTTGFHYHMSEDFFLNYRHGFYRLTKSVEFIQPYLSGLARRYEDIALWWIDKSIFFFEAAVFCVGICCSFLVAAIILKIVDKIIKSGIIVKLGIKVYKFFFVAVSGISVSFENLKVKVEDLVKQVSEFFLPYKSVDGQNYSFKEMYKEILPYLENFRPPSKLPDEFKPAREVILKQLSRNFKPDYPIDIPLLDPVTKWFVETLSDPVVVQALKTAIDLIRRFL
jgi:NADH-quinone oxidoreductase subunit J